MKSFALLRTNVGLTTNVKIMVDSDHNLSLNSIDSSENLSIDRFKKFKFTKSNYYDEIVPYFFKDIPSDTAFEIKFDEDNETMSDDFSLQYDEIYSYGARNIENNKNYKEEFEYFAPLYINRKNLPKKFIIFRVDGPGLTLLNKDNFKQEILDKLKTVKVFDLTAESILGQWLENNFINNNNFPQSPLEIDFRELEFCKWNGIDYSTGGYTSKSLFIDDILDEEKEIFELEKFIFNNYKNNNVIFPNILNFSFLFDDEPSTPEFKRKWSLNRYFGFYLEDMELVKTISPYITPFLRKDVEIFNGNIIYSPSSPENPFIIEWTDKRPFYIEYNGNYYKVEKYTETGKSILTKNKVNSSINQPKFTDESYTFQTITRFRIISDLSLVGKESLINKNYGTVDSRNSLKDYDNQNISIQNFDDYSCWLIEIDGIFHNLIKRNDIIYVNTDYSFTFNENDYTYTVGGISKKISTVVDNLNNPKKFNIYRLKFSDIKDFDNRIIESDFARFEYEKKEDVTNTDETKLYLEDLNFNSLPRPLDDFIYKDNVTFIPTSSEYIANWETFKIENNNLSEIWRLNPVYCRWSAQNSIHSYDLPYMLNNSLIMESFNRGTNTLEPYPQRIERNLDYFYTINSSTSSYVYHSLHIEEIKSDGTIDTSFEFDLAKYLNIGTYSSDYFSNFFEKKIKFSDSKIHKNSKKYSVFNIGDNVIPNITFFRGIEFRIFDVESISLNTINEIQNINLSSSNKFENYKFSILLSDNDKTVNDNGELVSTANSMNWQIIEEWQMDKEYPYGSIVMFDDILYTSTDVVQTSQPATNQGNESSQRRIPTRPSNILNWNLFYTPGLIFWHPQVTYTNGDIVYNNGEYYSYMGEGNGDFYNPKTVNDLGGYNIDECVLYRGQYYISTTSSNIVTPDSLDTWTSTIGDTSIQYKYWKKTTVKRKKWNEVELWSSTSGYSVGKTIVHSETIWISTTIVYPGEEPGVANKWQRKYSLIPDTTFNYQPTATGNSIIRMNNRYYFINSNVSNSTLDNGIIVYINKKWKNILVNINISDNTFLNVKNADRDLLYTDLYKKITANNFINCLNNIENKYGFTDYVSYVVIEENGSISKYNLNNNITSLPHIINCEFPDLFTVKINSLEKLPVKLPEKITPTRTLKDGKINKISELNWLNTNLPIASNIIQKKFEPKIIENYHGNQNLVKNEMYRFSGNYMPLFYEIELFEKGNENRVAGNYKFDTELTEFGIMKERKMRKCNLKGSVLKLKNEPDTQSIYPMIDEYGYTISDFFIFKSTWDYEYHVQTIQNPQNINIIPDISLPNIKTVVSETIGRPRLEDDEEKINRL